MIDEKYAYTLGLATLKAENAERALSLLEDFTKAVWKRYASGERKQIYRAIANQRDKIRRLNVKVDMIVTYMRNNPTGRILGNKGN